MAYDLPYCILHTLLKIFVSKHHSISSMSPLIELRSFRNQFPLTLIDLAEGRDSYIMMADPPRRNTGSW